VKGESFMKITVIKEPKLYCEDGVGDFVGLFELGEVVAIKTIDNKPYEASIEQIYDDEILIETIDFESIFIKIEDIEEIEKL
jgi:hypothetical protein